MMSAVSIEIWALTGNAVRYAWIMGQLLLPRSDACWTI